MKKHISICLGLFFIIAIAACNSEKIDNMDHLSQKVKNAQPGDTIIISKGTYTDVQIKLMGKGSKEKPIVILAEEAGKVYIEGKSNLQIGGENLVISGLYFRNGYSDTPVISYKSGSEVANNCRVTNSVIEDYNPESRVSSNAWIALYGRNNRFDHNTLIGKQNAEATLVVQLNEERSQENNHSIDHNFFGSRPNYGSNGAETIRVGNSTYSLTSSRTQITDNWFEHCDGEVEHVSIKSCDNLIARNVFYESAGELVLRHGNRNIVEENIFIGNNKPHTGGIRVVNADQIIRKNYLQDLKGKRFYAALAVMNAVPNPLPNRYHQVENALIENNTFVRCDHIEFGVGADFERTVSPAKTLVKDNFFYYPEKTTIFESHTDMSGVSFENNKAVTAATKQITGIQLLHNQPPPSFNYPIKREECGANWYIHTTPEVNPQAGKTILAKEEQNALIEAIENASAGDTILLQNNTNYLVNKSINIDKLITIQTTSLTDPLPVIRYNGSKGKTPIFTIQDGGILHISGVEFNGAPYQGNSRAMSGISPAEKMKGTYSAYIDNCVFSHFEESSFAGFKALKNSFADTLYFNNCSFHNISGEGIGLGAEKNDDGRYSAENIIIRNCNFYKILNCAVNIYRGGNDESTTGPFLQMENCSFEDSSNQERGATLRLIGVQTAWLNGLTFKNSGRGGAAIKFDECAWDDIQLNDIHYENSGRLRMNKLYK